jgi:hypothetical protein
VRAFIRFSLAVRPPFMGVISIILCANLDHGSELVLGARILNLAASCFQRSPPTVLVDGDSQRRRFVAPKAEALRVPIACVKETAARPSPVSVPARARANMQRPHIMRACSVLTVIHNAEK